MTDPIPTLLEDVDLKVDAVLLHGGTAVVQKYILKHQAVAESH